MRVVVLEPGKLPEIRDIENDLATMQGIVGGSIEVVQCEKYPDFVIVCNEKGKTRGLEPNVPNYADVIFGTCFICGLDDDDFVGFAEWKAQEICETYSY